MKKAAVFLLSILLMLSAGAADAAAVDGTGPAAVDAADTAAVDEPDAPAADGADTADADASPVQPVNPSRAEPFADVAPEDWYCADVSAAYALGLMDGESDGWFNADGQVTMAQAVVMAARLHRLSSTGSGEFEAGDPWYQPYVNYAREHGLLSGDPDLSAAATRAQFADLLSRALPAGDLAPINDIAANAIPDVKAGDAYADSIYLLYRAGVLTGSGPRGAFYPSSSISRAEAAAVMARMADKSLRKAVVLQYAGPRLAVMEAKDDSFFEHSAILGNSLVEGLRMFSKLKTLHYFSATSVSVVSATQTKNVRLNDGSMGTLVQALCQEQYDKIYIELGINEIGGNVDTFIQRYGGMIDTIRAAEPNADIYILSVLPVTRGKSQSGVFNMTRVNLYNAALYQLAGEKQCYYMDVCAWFQGSDGYLPASWSSDGVHLYAQYYAVWENCIRTLY